MSLTNHFKYACIPEVYIINPGFKIFNYFLTILEIQEQAPEVFCKKRCS